MFNLIKSNYKNIKEVNKKCVKILLKKVKIVSFS